MRSFLATTFAAVVAANEPFMIEAVPSNSIAINQIAGAENFTIIPKGTYPSPDPVQTNNTEKFFIQGVWNVSDSALDHVEFVCYLMGAKVFDETYDCTGKAANADYGNCPVSTGVVGEIWSGDFGFDVPVIGMTVDGTKLWELESKFKI